MNIKAIFSTYFFDEGFIILFFAFFSFGYLFFFKDKKNISWNGNYYNGQFVFYIGQFFKVFLFALGISLISTYLQINWLKPLFLMASTPTSDTLKIILTFIGIMFSFLMALSIYGYNLIHSHYKQMVFRDVADIEKKLTFWKDGVSSNENRISLLSNYLRDFLRATNLKDENAIKRIMLYGDLLPIFEDPVDKVKNIEALKSALQILKQNPDARNLLNVGNWNFVEDILAPRFKNNIEIYSLITDVLKKK